MIRETFHSNPDGQENVSFEDYRLTEAEAAYVGCWLGQDSPALNAVPEEVAKNAPTPRLAEIFKLLGQAGEPEVPSGLAHRTMALARQVSSSGANAWSNNAGQGYPRLRIGWDRRKIDLAAMSVAAGLLFVVLISGIHHARFVADRTACAENLTALASAFSGYAADDAGMLPRIATPTDANWLPRIDTPGQLRSANAHSNLANLRPLLVRGEFATWKRLICPSCQLQHLLGLNTNLSHGLPTGDISYSYIDQLAPYHHHWGSTGHVVIMADYNPLFQAQTRQVSETSNSFNHNQRGENILSDDGSVRWVTTPDVGPKRDNIWTVQGDSTPPFTGREEPKSIDDILVVP